MKGQDVRGRIRFVNDSGHEAIVLMVATWRPAPGDRFRVSVIEPGGEYDRAKFETEAEARARFDWTCDDHRKRGYAAH
jgi:hypothetical protein